MDERELISRQELNDRLGDMPPGTPEHEALLWMRDIYYLADEGFISLEGDRCYPGLHNA